jgi:hypothetical protein
VKQGHEENTTDSPIKISKRMDGLKPAISHSQELRDRMEIWHVRLDVP